MNTRSKSKLNSMAEIKELKELIKGLDKKIDTLTSRLEEKDKKI